jgi:hypothetical protein
MKTTGWAVWVRYSLVGIAVAASSCRSDAIGLTGVAGNEGAQAGSSVGAGAGTPGVAGSVGAIGTGGMSSSAGTSGGMGGTTAGSSAAGGAGATAMAGASGAAGNGSGGRSSSGSGGASGGSGANAAGSGGGGDATVAQCLADVMSSGFTVTSCEMCLCQAGTCQAELSAIKSDTAAKALVSCTETNHCSGQCCLCATNGKGAMCDSLGSNYAKGKCATEVETAAGVTPGAGAITNGSKVTAACSVTGPPDNACARAARLAKCATDKCASACPNVAVACP